MKKIGIGIIAIISLFFLTACGCEKQDYEVVFSNDGGRTVVVVEQGEKLKKPADPQKEGYTFMGWYTNLNSTEAYDFTEEVESNFVLYAKWVKDAVCTLTCGEGYTLVNPGSTNCSCKKIDSEEEPVDKPVVAEKFTVKFDSNGGSTVKSKTVTSGNKVNKPTEPTREDYKFVGWYLNGKEYNFNSKVTKNITLVAKWEKVETKPSTPTTPDTPETPEEEKDVLGYDVISDSKSIVGQGTIYITKNGEKVAGNADIVTVDGTVINKNIPKDGYKTNVKRIDKLINIKVD